MPNFVDKVAWVLDDVTYRVASLFRQSIDSYCDLETAETTSKHALTDHSGGLISLIDLSGVNDLPGAEETERVVDRLTTGIGPLLSNSAYSIQVVFEYDPTDETGSGELKEHAYRLRRGAQRNGIENIGDVIEDNIKAINNYTAFERCTLVVRTTTRLLRSQDIKAEHKAESEYKQSNLPVGPGTQNTQLTLRAVLDAHEAFVEQVKKQMEANGLVGRVLDQYEACFRIRTQVDPEATSSQWEANLPGDPVRPTNTGKPAQAATDWMWPRMAPQLMPRDPQIESLKTVRIGDRIYSPVIVDRCPKEPKPFATLFSNLKSSKTPYRISFRLQGDGLKANNLRYQVANNMTFAGSQNKRIQSSFRDLQDYVNDEGGVVVGLAIDATTWAPAGHDTSLHTYRNQLSAALQAWGGAEIAEVTGSPLDAISSSVAGLRIGSPANNVCIPLDDALGMLPIMRPSSPWNYGNLLMRSSDGKVFPYRAYSKTQDAWITLIFAPMGRGKSVLLNALNLGLCLDETNTTLPIIRILDIGFSSSGLISLLQTALPPGRKHEALYKKLKMSTDDAINPMDTPLGCRRPLASHSAFLAQLFSYLTTPIDKDAPPDGMPGIAKMVIQMAYNRYSDDGNPKPYNPGISREVDKAIEKNEIPVDVDTTWWEVTDALVAKGDTVTAYVSQSFAMPLVSECAAFAKSDEVARVYKGKHAGEPLGDQFWRMVTEAVGDYPILNGPTKLNFGAARVVSLDLQEVAPSGESSTAARQTGLMYTLAMWVMSSEFFLDENVLNDIPGPEYFADRDRLVDAAPDYRTYHEKRIEDMRSSKKRMGADEFHRTRGQAAVRSMFERIIREGRKYNVESVLASQRHEDFDDAMIGLSSVRFVLGTEVGHEQTTAERIGLGESAAFVMSNHLVGPGPGGSPLLASFNVKFRPGVFNHMLTNIQGPRALWAFSSSSDDVRVRDRLYKRIGPEAAREILAFRYPGGSIGSELEKRHTSLENATTLQEGAHNPIRDIENELVEDAELLRKQRLLENAGLDVSAAGQLAPRPELADSVPHADSSDEDFEDETIGMEDDDSVDDDEDNSDGSSDDATSEEQDRPRESAAAL